MSADLAPPVMLQPGMFMPPQPADPAFTSASLYVGDLSPEVTEALLFDLFNAVGPVASIRVCRDAVTRRSLGYAYVNFSNHADAERALDTMNYTLIKGVPCRMMWSHRDPSLRKNGAGNVFVKNLAPEIDNKNLYDTFSLFGDILSCKVVVDRNGQSKGYGFVHFETVEAAEEAISKINGMMIAGREVFVGRFVKSSERTGFADWTNCYVKNIPLHWNQQRLEDEFSQCGPIASSTIMTDEQGASRGFGFVDFADHESAAKAVATLNEKVVLTKLGEETGPEEAPEEQPAAPAPAAAASEKKEGGDAAADATTPPPPAAAASSSSESNKGGEDSAGAAAAAGDEDFDKSSSPAATESTKKKPLKTQILYVGRAQKKSERERELATKFDAIKKERMNKYQGTNVFVKNLAEEVDDEMLRKEFSQYGTISSARVMRDSLDGKPASDGASVTDIPAPAQAAPSGAPPATPGGKSVGGSTATGTTGSGPSRGFGFVCFTSTEEATKAVTEANGRMLAGKPIFVALAQRKEARRAQLEAQHGSRGVGGLVRGLGPMQPAMYPPMYFQGPTMGGPPGPMHVPGAGMRTMGYFQAAPVNMGGMGGNGGRGGQQMGGMVPRGAAGAPGAMPVGMAGYPGAVAPVGAGGRPNAFPPNVMYSPGQVPGMGGIMGANASSVGRARRQTRQNAGGQRQPRVGGGPYPGAGVPGAPAGAGGQAKYPGMPGGELEPLTAAALANQSVEQQKNILGERLFPLIQDVQPALAGKITGMLLEMDNPELLNLLESPEALNDKINEALHVLEDHQAATAAGPQGGEEQ